uniref:Uncharacterized protein n=1 Tax=Octopus bimaculoides TaxID=37653 RepID=A0A0L8I338_OCTBM
MQCVRGILSYRSSNGSSIPFDRSYRSFSPTESSTQRRYTFTFTKTIQNIDLGFPKKLMLFYFT